MRLILSIFFLSSFLISCSKKVDEKSITENRKQEFILSNKFEVKPKVKNSYRDVVNNWEEYNTFYDFLKLNFDKTNLNLDIEAMKELSMHAKSLKDSVLPEKINDPALKSRLNLLYSETLRLYDMSTINNLSDSLVSSQISKIYSSFSGVNAKINSSLEQQKLEELFGDDDAFKKLDSLTFIKKEKTNKPKRKSSNRRGKFEVREIKEFPIKGKKKNNL